MELRRAAPESEFRSIFERLASGSVDRINQDREWVGGRGPSANTDLSEYFGIEPGRKEPVAGALTPQVAASHCEQIIRCADLAHEWVEDQSFADKFEFLCTRRLRSNGSSTSTTRSPSCLARRTPSAVKRALGNSPLSTRWSSSCCPPKKWIGLRTTKQGTACLRCADTPVSAKLGPASTPRLSGPWSSSCSTPLQGHACPPPVCPHPVSQAGVGSVPPGGIWGGAQPDLGPDNRPLSVMSSSLPVARAFLRKMDTGTGGEVSARSVRSDGDDGPRANAPSAPTVCLPPRVVGHGAKSVASDAISDAGSDHGSVASEASSGFQPTAVVFLGLPKATVLSGRPGDIAPADAQKIADIFARGRGPATSIAVPPVTQAVPTPGPSSALSLQTPASNMACVEVPAGVIVKERIDQFQGRSHPRLADTAGALPPPAPAPLPKDKSKAIKAWQKRVADEGGAFVMRAFGGRTAIEVELEAVRRSNDVQKRTREMEKTVARHPPSGGLAAPIEVDEEDLADQDVSASAPGAGVGSGGHTGHDSARSQPLASPAPAGEANDSPRIPYTTGAHIGLEPVRPAGIPTSPQSPPRIFPSEDEARHWLKARNI